MSKIPLVLRELHRAETGLARDLLALADRHRADAEIFHVARDVATWSQIHVRRLAEAGAEHGVRLDPEPRWTLPGPLPGLKRTLAHSLRRRRDPGLLLLADLRHVHRVAAGVSLDWELLAQSAQGMKQRALLELAQNCHPQTLRQMRWANAQLKESSTQVIAS
jgi:hypothetical protein